MPSLSVEPPAEKQSKHALNARTLIDNAMGLGLVCSVVRPARGEKISDRVAKVAELADIVCLDWELYNDRGASAAKIIRDIVYEDAKRHGRLRLIAIYTGDTTNQKILEKVFDTFPKTFQRKHSLKREALHITNGSGLKVVWLFKAHGIQLTDSRKANQVDEAGLPRDYRRNLRHWPAVFYQQLLWPR